MYSIKEKEIIERCLSISAWNYKVGKLLISNKEDEAKALMGKVRKEMLSLKKIISGFPLMEGIEEGVNLKIGPEVVFPKIGFFSRLRNWF